MTPPLEGEMQGNGPFGSGQSDPDETTSLQALLDRWGSLPLGASLVLFDDLLAGLDSPRLGGVGRELTARGVVVDGGGHVHRGDAISSSPYGAGAGSPASAAPERRSGGPPTLAADVYAVSALFYEAATGLPPQVAAGDGRVSAAGLDSQVPEAVMAVARQGLASDPDARPSPGLLRARIGIAGDAALHEWQNRGRTWLSSAVATLRPTPDVVPPKIDWSAYGPRPGSEPESTGFVGLSARPRTLIGFGIAFTGLLMTIIGTCNIGSAPPQAGVSAATQQPASVATPTPAATTNPGFVVPTTPSAAGAGEATVSPSPSTPSAPAPTSVPTALPTTDPNAFTPFPVPTDLPTQPPAPTPTPGGNCLLFC